MEQTDLDLFERSVHHATDRHTGVALDDALDELGWSEALDDDPHAAVSVLFGLQGRANATSSSLGRVVAHGLGLDPSSGAALVLPAVGQSDPPGRLDGERVHVHGVAPARLTELDDVVVLSTAGDDVLAVTVSRTSLDLRPIGGVDPSAALVEVTASGIHPTSMPDAPTSGWADGLALARVAVAPELVGASRAMLDLAREHALDRIQFGVPISSFQAVRHRLAETLVAIETADAVVDAAWLDRSPGTAAMAKALAGREGRTAARHCQQVLAGIGFTTEHPFHRYFRRVLLLDALLDTSKSLTRDLGDELLATRHLPPLIPL